jgi:Flp pilus assembly protein TadB
MEKDYKKKNHKVEVIIVRPYWDNLDSEEKENILLAATALYKSKTRRKEDIFTAWKERGEKYTNSDRFHPLIDHFRYLENKELRQKDPPRVEFTKPWRLFIVAGTLTLISWGIIIWVFQKIFSLFFRT